MGVVVLMRLLIVAVDVLVHLFLPEAVDDLEPQAHQHHPHKKLKQEGHPIGYGESKANDDQPDHN